jgi:hypothetical protein
MSVFGESSCHSVDFMKSTIRAENDPADGWPVVTESHDTLTTKLHLASHQARMGYREEVRAAPRAWCCEKAGSNEVIGSPA